jgi:hypothetical protein
MATSAFVDPELMIRMLIVRYDLTDARSGLSTRQAGRHDTLTGP